jgi:hypothetical protein
LLKEFKFVTRVRFIENGDDTRLYHMELFQNSPGSGTKVRIDDELLHCYRIVNTKKRFRFLETDINMTPRKWRCLNWELKQEEDGSLTASNANPYIIMP